MDIYIKRDDGQFGPFSPEQIEECLASGALIETDIAWHAALPDWVPVTEVLGTLEPAPAQAPTEPVPAKVAKSGSSKKLLIAGVTAVVVLGAAAALMVPKFLNEGGDGDSPLPKSKVAVNLKTNTPPNDIPDKIGNADISTNALSVPLAPNGPSSTSFDAVTQHLDTGGSFYFYLSTDEAQAWVRSGFDEGGKLLEQFGPMLGEEGAGQAAMGFATAKALYAGIGLEAIDGIGASTRSLGDGLKRNVAMFHHDPAKSDGILWKAFGSAVHDLDGLSLMPAETVYAFHGDLALAAILAWAKTMAAANLPPQATQSLTEMLAQPQVQQALGAYGGKVGVYVTLDFKKLHKLPINGVGSTLPGSGKALPSSRQTFPSGENAVPGGLPPIPAVPSDLPPGEGVATLVGAGDGLEIPEPGLVLTIKVNNGDLLTMLQQFAESMNMPLEEVDFGGVKAYQFPQPIPFPPLPEIVVQPVVFQSGGYLVFTSSPVLAAKVLATQAEPDTGLRGTAEFKKLTKGMELKGNQFTFMSGRVAGLYGNILKQGMAAEAAMLPEPVQNLMVRLMTLGMKGQVSVLQVLPEGFLVHSHTEGMGYDSAVLAVAGVVPLAVGAALVLPAIQSGRFQAQEVQSMNNLKHLAIAIHEFHEDNDHLPDATKWSDELLPFVGNDKQVFISSADPDGSSYAFNKNLSGMKLDDLQAAARTVVFFESDLGWNGAGGIDDAIALGDDFLIGFADGHMERVSGEDLDKLNWTP
ncbi:MAG: GYF domain-containing protein [Verrucomicrobiota bacterium]|nr:GYF domain-containing protein [Verrucomicrobiota bacterium]